MNVHTIKKMLEKCCWVRLNQKLSLGAWMGYQKTSVSINYLKILITLNPFLKWVLIGFQYLEKLVFILFSMVLKVSHRMIDTT